MPGLVLHQLGMVRQTARLGRRLRVAPGQAVRLATGPASCAPLAKTRAIPCAARCASTCGGPLWRASLAAQTASRPGPVVMRLGAARDSQVHGWRALASSQVRAGQLRGASRQCPEQPSSGEAFRAYLQSHRRPCCPPLSRQSSFNSSRRKLRLVPLTGKTLMHRHIGGSVHAACLGFMLLSRQSMKTTTLLSCFRASLPRL